MAGSARLTSCPLLSTVSWRTASPNSCWRLLGSTTSASWWWMPCIACQEEAEPLARLLQEKTGGNPLFAIQFFTSLAIEGLLALDPVAPAWQWDINRIRAGNYTDNAVDLVAGNLRRLPANPQEALKQFACLGNVAEIATLTLVHGETEAAAWINP
jgi:predicted ATPase